MRMQMNRRISVVALVAAAALGGGVTRAAEVKANIGWQKFLGRSDLVWNKLPSKWEEGAYTGNGLLGANLWTTDDGKYVKFPIGRSDVVYREARIPIGDLVLKTVGTVTGGSLRLDLWNAEITGDIQTTAGKVHIRTFTHAQLMVQIIELTPDAGEAACTFTWAPGIPQDPRAIAQKTPIADADKNPEPTTGESEGSSFCTQPLKTGGGFTTAWSTTTAASGPRSAYISVGYATAENNTGKAEALAAVAQAKSAGVDALTASHRDWWHQYWPESFVSVPDARIESFYQIQMYKLASATRKDRQVIDLMGPWFRTGPWPRIWWNLNVQLTYWPIYTANRLELGEPFCKILDDHKQQLAANAKSFSADSYAIGRSCSYDLAKSVQPEIGNLPWALHNYWLQYRYSMDDTMLRDRLFPLLKGSINYYLHILKRSEDGKLHIPLGLSPEYPGQPTPDPDCNYDLALLRWGCQTLLDTCDRLKIDDAQIPQWKDTLATLTPYPTDDTGLKISASVADTESHRHYSHLLMIYPLHTMTMEQPENRELIEKSFAHWSGMPKAFRGFSFTGASSISSTLNRGDDALKWLNAWFETDTKFKVTPNTMYAEAGPVIESPLSGAAAVNDMLLGSWGGKLRIFPGVASSWQDVSFAHLRGEGAFLVTAVHKAGKTVTLKIESEAGEPCHIVTDMDNPKADGLQITKTAEHEFTVALAKGQSVVLTPDGAPASDIAPVPIDPGQSNPWGVK